MPFANDNAGTIKQRSQRPPYPPLSALSYGHAERRFGHDLPLPEPTPTSSTTPTTPPPPPPPAPSAVNGQNLSLMPRAPDTFCRV